MKCEEVRCLLKTMMHNVKEAQQKIHKAYEWKEKHKGIADWQRQMAVAHLEFNDKAEQMVRAGFQEIRNEHGHNHDHDAVERMMGRCEAYEEWLEQIGPETAEVRAMIDAYGR